MNVQSDLQKLGTKEKAKTSSWFFKTGKGQYGEGDIFLGVTVPEQRIVAKRYQALLLSEIEELLKSPVHEHRLTGFIILTLQYKQNKKKIYQFYLAHTKYSNNWDLVDTSAQIVGKYLLEYPQEKNILIKLAKSPNLWEKRISIVATHDFIKANKFEDTFAIATLLLPDSHDLIHKAVGWMLREVGKKDEKALEAFLQKHYKTMPRTMLRYALEKFDKQKRIAYMTGKV